MPGWSHDLKARLAELRLSPAREAEIIEELSQHLDDRYAELRAAGSSDAEARRMALDELNEAGGLAQPDASPVSGAHASANQHLATGPGPAARRLAGRAVRPAHAAKTARIRGRNRDDARPRYRRQHCRVHHRQRCGPPAGAVQGRRAARQAQRNDVETAQDPDFGLAYLEFQEWRTAGSTFEDMRRLASAAWTSQTTSTRRRE